MNRNNQVHDYLMKSARYIVNYCLNHEIGTIVVGYNPDWKRDANMGKATIRTLCRFLHGQLRYQLENLCERYGLRCIEQEESYTSKASFLDGDALPVWNGTHQDVTFSGKRVKRGLYRAKAGRTLNRSPSVSLWLVLRRMFAAPFTRGFLANSLRVKLTSVSFS